MLDRPLQSVVSYLPIKDPPQLPDSRPTEGKEAHGIVKKPFERESTFTTYTPQGEWRSVLEPLLIRYLRFEREELFLGDFSTGLSGIPRRVET